MNMVFPKEVMFLFVHRFTAYFVFVGFYSSKIESKMQGESEESSYGTVFPMSFLMKCIAYPSQVSLSTWSNNGISLDFTFPLRDLDPQFPCCV